MNYHTTTLRNGLRIIHRPSASPVVYCGYQIRVGSRDELPGEEGLAHFCEHMTFKGTTHRRAWNIINRLEQVGGDLNAFTNKEDTTYYAAILKAHVGRAIDLLTDMVFHSTYPQAEIDKEIAVVCDEIESYNDSPSELIYDELENIVFKGHPLGHSILGTAERVRSFDSARTSAFARRHYRPSNAIFFIDGDVAFERVVAALEKADIPDETGVFCNPDAVLKPEGKDVSDGLSGQVPKPIVVNKGTHQAHVMLGCRAYDIHHPRRMALYLLNNMLGGPGMNARFNMLLREHRGLVYTVDSAMTSYGDTGLWSVYFGCDAGDVARCRRLVRNELDRRRRDGVSETRLKAAKRQIKGQIGVACDSRENFALDFGKSFLHYGWEKDIARLFAHIDAVTTADVQAVADELFAPERLVTLIYQ